jgi:HAD superfamily hydrolase (TIGR01662 family)
MKEIVIVMGYNAAGKSTLVKEFTDQGYHRINRDEMGGTIKGQADAASTALSNSHPRVVLDNTYPTKEARATIIAVGKKLGVPVRCVWLNTSFEDAQLNACLRMVQRTGKLLMPEDFKTGPHKNDPNLFPPVALFNYKKHFEKPTTKEGFSAVEERDFVRRWPSDHINKALLLDYDNTLRRSTGKDEWPTCPSEVELLPGRTEVLKRYQKQGYLLLGASNQSACAKGLAIEVAQACYKRTNELLGLDIEVMFCPHKIPPVVCYCRKPHPGIGAAFILKHKLDPAQCIMVGDQTSDKTFAGRCGFQYKDAVEFFGS